MVFFLVVVISTKIRGIYFRVIKRMKLKAITCNLMHKKHNNFLPSEVGWLHRTSTTNFSQWFPDASLSFEVSLVSPLVVEQLVYPLMIEVDHLCTDYQKVVQKIRERWINGTNRLDTLLTELQQITLDIKFTPWSLELIRGTILTITQIMEN